MDNYFTKKEQIVILVVAIVIVFILGFKFLNKNNERREMQEMAKPLEIERLAEEPPLENSSIEESKEIMVHISGAINHSGIIILESGKRLIDAVELAGGLKKDADLDKINLAKILQDEDKIYIPKIDEDVAMENPTIISTGSSSTSQGKIDINCCSKEELMTLPGIGDVTANKILDYRIKTSFKKIEDIMEVAGIGEKKFASIQELIIVK